MKLYKPFVVILFGPPGSGKDTQAELLSKRYLIFHFDTGSFLRRLFKSKLAKTDKIVRLEKKINEEGKLNSPLWVLKIVKSKIKEFQKANEGIILSGSPRTLIEAFGDKKHQGLMDFLKKAYQNIFIFFLNVSEKEIISRLTERKICQICQVPILGKAGRILKKCPFCQSQLIVRKDDRKAAIKVRINEYFKRTLPILNELEKRKFRIFKINGEKAPFKIHQEISKIIDSAIK